MISVEEDLIDEVTAAFHSLRTGKVPPPLNIPENLPDNEIRQLLSYANRFLIEFAPFAESMGQMSQGVLDTPPLLGRMPVVQAFKGLQSNLRHLTWKTQQIAGGDLDQRVDFMGDFSSAFNSMTQQLKDSYESLVAPNKELDRRNQFIRKTFGRYTSDEIVEALLDVPDGLKLGGEKREVTILMSDLRGFTALADRLEAIQVVALLNHYLSAMVEVIQQSGGIIDEIIGDAILVLFGAPLAMEDATQRAVRCALTMQKAMAAVNEYNLQSGWPELEMGIALHAGEVVVGNIGSTKRSKYGVVGSTVNLTARIESFTVGGQILVSPALMRAVERGLILGENVEVHAKGMREALICRMLLGHEEFPDLTIEDEEASPKMLAESLPIYFMELTGKHVDKQMRSAILVALSHRRALIETAGQLALHTNIMLRLDAEPNDAALPDLYAKVIISLSDPSRNRYIVHFTSVSDGMRVRLQQLASGPDSPWPSEQ